MTVLRFDDASGNARGLLSFFAVHGTSIYEVSVDLPRRRNAHTNCIQNNTLVSSDNKGMAAYLYEAFAEPDAMPGNASFVAGFTQSNVGDTSPNTLVIALFVWNETFILTIGSERSARAQAKIMMEWRVNSTTRLVEVLRKIAMGGKSIFVSLVYSLTHIQWTGISHLRL